MAKAAAEGPLRRRHRRRGRPRPVDRLLPCQARRNGRRGAGQGLRRRRRQRPEHRHHPRQLPHARRHPILPGEPQALRGPLSEPRLQPAVHSERPAGPGAQRLGCLRPEDARRVQPALRRRQQAHRPGGDQEAGACARPPRGQDAARDGGALPSPRRGAPPRRGRVGLRQGRGPAGRRDSPFHRGHRDHARERQGDRRGNQCGPCGGGDRRERHGRLELDDRGDGRPSPADRHSPPAGLRDGAAEAADRHDHLLSESPRLRLPDGARARSS